MNPTNQLAELVQQLAANTPATWDGFTWSTAGMITALIGWITHTNWQRIAGFMQSRTGGILPDIYFKIFGTPINNPATARPNARPPEIKQGL